MYLTVFRITIFCLLSLCLSTVPAAAQFLMDEPAKTVAITPFTVQAEAQNGSVEAGRTTSVRIIFGVQPGYRLYVSEIEVQPVPVAGLRFGDLKMPPGVEEKEPDGKTAVFYTGDTVLELPVHADISAEAGVRNILLAIKYRGCSATNCFFPEQKELSLPLEILPKTAASSAEKPAFTEKSPALEKTDIPDTKAKSASSGAIEDAARRFGLAGVLLAAFIWGFLTSLTPCVYPVIPITVSVIGARNTGSLLRGFVLSLFYVLGMSLTYAGFGVAAAWSGGLFGAWSDHPAVRITVAVILVILALSMFDLLHIQMPSSVANRLNRYSGRGYLGVFLTGAASGAVVGPCVGPMLVGLLVYIAALGSKWQGFLIMWSFALGMGMLFLVIGTFSGAASALPKAGGWMENIRSFFGVLMLGAALYYIHPLLPEPVFYLVLGGLLTGVGVFTGALDALPPDASRYEKLRRTVAILCLVLGVVYGARFASGDALKVSRNHAIEQTGIVWNRDETAGLALAKQEKKPVIIDFYADWCSACKQMERDTFSHPDVIRETASFIMVKIDCTDSGAPHIRALQKKYQVVGLPTIIFIDPSGRILEDRTITEFIPPSDMTAQMRRVQMTL